MSFICGIHSVREALLAPAGGLTAVYVCQDARNPRLQEILQAAREKAVPVHRVQRQALDRLVGGTHHQDIAARQESFQYQAYEQILSAAVAPGLLLVLDGVEDPQNLGAVMRTADAAGVAGLFIPERRAATVTPAAIKVSAGGAAHVRVAREINLSRLLERLKEDGYWIVGLDAEAAEAWTVPDYTVPTALVLGGEGKGIRPLVKSKCDRLVRLPMHGHVSSLNVSVTAGIVLYEVLRQRATAPRS
jgi:23S rRNA (guanosine2251-2'-O)-methyltransferase